jgi:hypothetical protein
MVTAIVQFKMPAPMSREQAKEVFMSTAPKYQQVPGLIRKYYLLSEDGGTSAACIYGNQERMPRAFIRRNGRTSSKKNMALNRRLSTFRLR